MLKKNRRQVAFPALHTIHSVGIIRDLDQDFDFYSQNWIRNSALTILDFNPKDEDRKQSENEIGLSDFSFWGLPKKQKIENFVSTPFDLLINFSYNDDDAIAYICAKSIAKFKVSTAPFDTIYDLVIDLKQQDGKSFINEIEKTVSNFNTKL